jgi:hypothetical protein
MIFLESGKGGIQMRTGVILYVVGEIPMKENTDIESEIKKLEPGADRVEVVAKNTGYFDIADAWWALTVKGMQLIICMIGEINSTGALQLKDRKLRLCG